jgi:hypothetical protein
MLKTDPGLTTELPVWLIVCTVILFVARVGLFLYEHEHPPVPSDEIHWQEFNGDAPLNDNHKLVLYYFTARWSAAVKKLEANAFSNKEVVKFINGNFQPIRIVDLSVEQQSNEPKVQKLEDKYGISALKVFPKIIVALPDGSEVQRTIGSKNSATIKKFLEDTINTEVYVRAKKEFKEANWKKAAELYAEYLTKNGYRADRSTYAVLREYFALRLANKTAEADELLKNDVKKVDPISWPYPLLAYLCHAIDEKELVKQAGDMSDRREELHAYLGTAYYLAGDESRAEEQLKKSTADVHYKEWLEFQLATSVLNRMNSKPSAKPGGSEKSE